MTTNLAEKQRTSLIKTITKLRNVNPQLGEKWRRNMLRYYYRRLSELILRQTLDAEPSDDAVEAFLPEVMALVDGTQDLAP